MKQFSLEEYLKNPSKKIVTRDGRNVRIICTDKRGTDFPIVALVECEDKEETCYYTAKGYWNSCEIESKIDLFFAPEKHEGWINIYTDINDNSYPGNHIFKSKEEAEESGRHCCSFTKDLYMTSIKIEWED